MLTRRQLLGGAGTTAALTLLSGCRDLIESAANSCPKDPAQSGGVTWVPDIGHPVFFGFQDHSVVTGAPRTMRIYYPTFEGSPQNAPVLRVCVGRWPVVLFLHGQTPGSGVTGSWHLKWQRFALVLARSGYVVVVPSHNGLVPFSDFGPAVNAALNDINFVRTAWSGSDWVDQRASSTVVAGHSNGALLAARVAAARPDFGAFASLGGGFRTLNDTLPALQVGGQPSFFMWATGGEGANNEDLDALIGQDRTWDLLPQSKYAAVYPGQHFDYLPASETGNAPRGACDQVGGLAADLVALFIASNIFSLTQVPIGLTRPQVQLTTQQQFFAGAHLEGEGAFTSSSACTLNLRWQVSGVTGSRQIS